MTAPRRRPTAHAALLLVALGTLAGCATGKRPTLVDQPSGTQDSAAAAVVDRLAKADTSTFTATYDITPTITTEVTQATVVVQGQRRRVTIGSVDYITDGTTSRTCVAGGTDCVDGIDQSRISNLQITQDFWGDTAATRLINVANSSLSPSTKRVDTIAGQPATCADVTVPSPNTAAGTVGTVVFCALEVGPLARYAGADVTITLTSYSATVDEALLSI